MGDPCERSNQLIMYFIETLFDRLLRRLGAWRTAATKNTDRQRYANESRRQNATQFRNAQLSGGVLRDDARCSVGKASMRKHGLIDSDLITGGVEEGGDVLEINVIAWNPLFTPQSNRSSPLGELGRHLDLYLQHGCGKLAHRAHQSFARNMNGNTIRLERKANDVGADAVSGFVDGLKLTVNGGVGLWCFAVSKIGTAVGTELDFIRKLSNDVVANQALAFCVRAVLHW